MLEMKQYIGTKIVDAKPMTKNQFNAYMDRGIEMMDSQGYLVKYPDGYKSWSPQEAFEEAYRPTSGMPFGLAIEAMKKGKRVARKGWNGKNMYAVLMPGYPDGIEVNEITRRQHNLPEGIVLRYRPYFQLLTAQKDIAMWAPSVSDCLADDWYIVE